MKVRVLPRMPFGNKIKDIQVWMQKYIWWKGDILYAFKNMHKMWDRKDLTKFHYKKTENRYNSWCKDCIYKLQKNRWKKIKLRAIKLMGGKCVLCGYNKNVAALEFHHRDPNQKEFSWNKMKCMKWDTIVRELQNLVLLHQN